MKLLLLLAISVSALGQTASLRGVITDPSGAAVPEATVQLRGPGGERVAQTDSGGRYAFPSLAAGKYQLRVIAKGFAIAQKKDLGIARPMVFDTQLVIRAEREVVNVDARTSRLGPDPQNSSGAVFLGERQIAALSDDPDELALQLQALAGPAPGPNGGQVMVDGFSGSGIPPKSSIHDVRINANPFSPEYDRPGFSRIEIFTKPGADSLHLQAFAQYNDDVLNSRNPLLTQTTRPPYRAQLYGFNGTGPVRKNKVSISLQAEHRQIDENAFIEATILDANLNPVAINQALPAPLSRTTVSPRVDFAFSAGNTASVRYEDVRIGLDNQGVGDFNLASRAYNERENQRTLQITNNVSAGPRFLNQARFQFLRSSARQAGSEDTPAIYVAGAFTGGGATTGNSGTVTNSWELGDTATFTLRRHTLQWGGRLRRSRLTDTALGNFAGAFTFYTLDDYRRALLQAPGAGAAQFSRNAGEPTTRVDQIDAGIFVNDDWRVRPNLTVSLGLRVESQSNLGARADWAPRVSVAWGIDGSGRRPARTVLRGGLGTFYDRIPLNVTLNSIRYNGVTQESFLIFDPTFFPVVPGAAALQSTGQPQQLRPVYRGIRAPELYQASAGIERQINPTASVSITWIGTRGVHLLNARNVNTPIGGAWPYGDRSIRLLTESAGFSRQNQVVFNARGNVRKVSMFGYYALSYGMDDNEGAPADPYNLRAEWGPSSYADMRHRAAAGSTLPLPWKIDVSPFVIANSGQPYNITTGLDPNLTGFAAARPAFTGRNSARGPANVNAAMRVSKTWALGRDAAGRLGKSTITATASTLNALNRANYAPPNGNLSSPYFGQYRSLGGLAVMNHGGAPSTYNRKIDLQLRFAF